MINKFNKFYENNNDEKILNWIIDKISNFGESSLTKLEKKILNNYKNGKLINISSEYDHYNKFIVSLLKDIKDNNISEKHAINFVNKFIDKKDLFEFIILLLKKGKLDFLTINDVTEDN